MQTPPCTHRFSGRKVILIGGSSHAGKSTLAHAVAAQLGWDCKSTDSLARHPGRPWNHSTGIVKPHVADHYATLTPDALLADVLAHYERNVLPLVEALIHEQLEARDLRGIMLEGSALWPEFADRLPLDPSVAAVWLTASDDLFTQRIHMESRYSEASPEGRHLIDKFLARTLRYNQRMVAACHRLGLTCLNVESYPDSAKLTQQCLSLVT